ncbi:MAG: PQQ-binding-like beta-propeller repeat protein [Candidatus Sabulitectum sp.]|nr:PQQ-binding-like beta-propeller repeat protein [Candidatus Sabulitectum sp.]
MTVGTWQIYIYKERSCKQTQFIRCFSSRSVKTTEGSWQNYITGKWFFCDCTNRVLPDRFTSSFLVNSVYEQGYLYTASSLGKVVKLDASTGNIVWETQTHSEPLGSMYMYSNSLVVCTSGSRALLIDSSTGTIQIDYWTVGNPTGFAETSTGNLLISTDLGVLYSLR